MQFWSTFKRVICEVLKTYLGKWMDALFLFLSRPGDVLSMFLVHIFVLWLSLKQVRIAFRVVTFLRLPELINLRGLIESNIYLVLLVMITCFILLDLTAIKLSLAVIRSQLNKLPAKKPNKESPLVVPEPCPIVRKNPPRACKKMTHY